MKQNAASFLIWSLLFQIIGFGTGFFALTIIPHPLVGIFVPSLIALSLCRMRKLPLSWQVLNALFPSALFISTSSEIPPLIYFGILLFFATVHLPALWTRIPYYPTPRETYDLILKELPENGTFTFIDIGCGVGDLLAYLARERPNGNFIGVEVALFPYLASKVKSLRHKNMAVSFKSFWRLHFQDYDYIYAFLSPAPMINLWNKVKEEKRPEAIFFSNSFEAPSSCVRTLGFDGKGTRVYIY